MQVVKDIFQFLFFPGLLFMLVCGGIIAFSEGRVKTALYGGEAPSLRSLLLGKTEGTSPALGGVVVSVLSLSAIGTAGLLLVGIEGDLLVLALLFSAVELLPLFPLAQDDKTGAAYLPLCFRVAAARLAALFCVCVSVSLRFPGEFAAGMGTFRGEGAFSALQVWSGPDFVLMLAALVLAAAALLLYNLGYPSWRYLLEGRDRGRLEAVFFLGAEWAGRAVAILLFIIIFLGYPWEGGKGVLAWSGAALGAAAVITAARAWAGGRASATLRRWQEAGFVLAVLSFTAALAAVL